MPCILCWVRWSWARSAPSRLDQRIATFTGWCSLSLQYSRAQNINEKSAWVMSGGRDCGWSYRDRHHHQQEVVGLWKLFTSCVHYDYVGLCSPPPLLPPPPLLHLLLLPLLPSLIPLRLHTSSSPPPTEVWGGEGRGLPGPSATGDSNLVRSCYHLDGSTYKAALTKYLLQLLT